VRVLGLNVGDRLTGCASPPADLVDVQIVAAEAVQVYNGMHQSDGAEITVRKSTAAINVRADVPVAVG
jgi:hypothetical protein